MKKLNNLFLLLIMLLITASCSNEQEDSTSEQLLNLTQEELLSMAYDNPQELSPESVTVLVTGFLNDIKEDEARNGISTRNADTNFTVDVSTKSYFTKGNNTLTRSGEEFQLPIYEVSVSSGGKNGVVYVSADERYAEVITYIPNVPDNAEGFLESGAALLVEYSKASAYERIEEIEKIRTATIAKVSKHLNIPQSEVTREHVIGKTRSEGPGEGGSPPEKPIDNWHLKVPPMIPVHWGQTAPYNWKLPVPTAPTKMKNVYSGCSVVAACQLMTAIRPDLTIDGIKIDWDYLSENLTIETDDEPKRTNMVSLLYKWVYQELQAKPVYDADGVHTGTTVLRKNSMSFYKARFFVDPDGDGRYDFERVKNSLILDGAPIFICGSGHAWALDGCITYRKPVATAASFLGRYDVLWHINLGWYGQYNGYYRVNPDGSIIFNPFDDKYYNSNNLDILPGLFAKPEKFNVTTTN